MTHAEFCDLYEIAYEQADDGMVQFIVTDDGVVVRKWELEDWSPVRSSSVDDYTRAYYHVLAMEQARVL